MKKVLILISSLLNGIASATIIDKVTVDTRIECLSGVVTKGTALMGDIHWLDKVELQLDSTTTIQQETIMSPVLVTFGSGTAKLHTTIKSWDKNKNEILVPLDVQAEIFLNAKKQKEYKMTLSTFNPFTESLQSKSHSRILFFYSVSFIYDEFTKTSPQVLQAEVGDLIQSTIFCNFKN